MNEERIQAVKNVKSLIKKMLEERHNIAEGSSDKTITPCDYWREYCTHFQYLMDLPEKYFATLREHTYHITGDMYPWYISAQKASEISYRKSLDGLWASAGTV